MSSSEFPCCFSDLWKSKNVTIIKSILISIKAMDNDIVTPVVPLPFAMATLGKINGDTSVAIM